MRFYEYQVTVDDGKTTVQPWARTKNGRVPSSLKADFTGATNEAKAQLIADMMTKHPNKQPVAGQGG